MSSRCPSELDPVGTTRHRADRVTVVHIASRKYRFFRVGVVSPSQATRFYMTVRGGDSAIIGTEDSLSRLCQTVDGKFEISTSVLSPTEARRPRVRVLNRALCWTDSCVIHEADQRHAEIIRKFDSCGSSTSLSDNSTAFLTQLEATPQRPRQERRFQRNSDPLSTSALSESRASEELRLDTLMRHAFALSLHASTASPSTPQTCSSPQNWRGATWQRPERPVGLFCAAEKYF